MQTITIKQIENGYIVTSKYGKEVETFAITADNISEEETERFKTHDNGRICVARLLDKINDLTGEPYSKWGIENLNISWDRPGHKAETI